MGFSNQTGYTFSEAGIAQYAPRKSGVYGIYKTGEWIYIGEAEDIEARLYEHVRLESDQSARIWRRQPTGFIFELCEGQRARKARETQLIAELTPSCN